MTICSQCREECTPVEETIDYPGTHCNYGRSGTAQPTGDYVSDCCLAEIEEEES